VCELKPDRVASGPFAWALGALLLLGFLARIAYVFAQSQTDPWFAYPMADGAAFLDWARERVAGVPPARDAYESPPLYGFALTLFVRTFGENLGLLYYAQHLAIVAAAGLLAVVARRAGGELAGLATCALFLLYGPHLFFASRPLGEAVAIALLCAALCAWTDPRTAGAAGTAGLLLGLAALARPNLLLAGPLWAGTGRGRELRRGGLLLGALLLALVPTTVRNQRQSGHFVPISSNSGLTLYHGNGPGATGAIGIAPELAQAGKGDQRRVATWLAGQRSGRPLDPVEADRFWGRQALRERLADPLGSLRLAGRRLLLVAANAELTLDTGPRQDVNPLRHAAPLPFAVLLGLAAAGVVAAGWRGTGGWTLWSAVLACAAAPLIFYVSSRYRLPLASMLCVPAGVGLAALWRAPAGCTPPRRRLALLWGAVLCAGSFANAGAAAPLAAGDAAGLLQRGMAWARAGDLARAEADFRRAQERQPGWAPAHVFLADILERSGRTGEAEVLYRQALELQPGYASAACHLGQSLNLTGRHAEALPFLRRGLAAWPFHEVCWNHLVSALAFAGQPEEALAEAAKAVELGVELMPGVTELVQGLKARSASGTAGAGAAGETSDD